MKRRDFLRSSILGLGLLVNSQISPLAIFAQDDKDKMLELSGDIRDVHDPVMIKQDDVYYVFSTGFGISVRQSFDMQEWNHTALRRAFLSRPEEAFAYVEGASNIWAPDISFYNDKYHLYYSVSTFGSNHSAIGLATNKTLHFDDEDYEWVDHGIVIKTDRASNYNAIDANLILDTEDVPWLVFGSHWSGIRMIRLDYETGKQSEEDDTVYSVASRAEHPRAVEAPFIIYRNGYYYLFVSYDRCCNGRDSTYNVRVGRSEAVIGPYLDREGVDMMNDGGTQILTAYDHFVGPGHNAIFREDEQDYIVYHAYDVDYGGIPTLRINPLDWDEDAWPVVAGIEMSE